MNNCVEKKKKKITQLMVHLYRTTHYTNVSVWVAPGRGIGRSLEEVWLYYFETGDRFSPLQFPEFETAIAVGVHSGYIFVLSKILLEAQPISPSHFLTSQKHLPIFYNGQALLGIWGKTNSQ